MNNLINDPDQLLPLSQLREGDSLGKQIAFDDLKQNPGAPDPFSLTGPKDSSTSGAAAIENTGTMKWSSQPDPGDTDPINSPLAIDTADGLPAAQSASPETATMRLDQPSLGGGIQFVPGIQASRPGIFRGAPPTMAPPAFYNEPGPGDTFWPGWTGLHAAEDRATFDTKVGKAFVDDGYRRHLAQNEIIEEMVSLGGGDAEALSKQSVNRAWVNSIATHAASDTEYQIWRDRIGKKFLEKDRTNDDELFGIGRELYAKKFARDDAVQKLTALTITQVFRDAPSGRQTSLGPTIENWATQNKNVLGESGTAPYLASANDLANRMRVDLGPLLVPAAQTFDTLTKYATNRANSDDLVKLGTTLGALRPEDRQKLYQYSVLIAEANHLDQSAVGQLFSNVGKEISRSFGFVGNMTLSGQEASVHNTIKFLDTGNTAYLGDHGRWELSHTTAGEHALAGNLPPEEKQALLQQYHAYQGALQVVRELKDVYKTKFAPIRMVAPDYSPWHYPEAGLNGLAGSTGYLAATAVNPLLGAAAIGEDEYQRLLTQNPDMDRDAARVLATTSGAAQAFLGTLQLKILVGRSPGLARVFEDMTPGVKKLTASVITSGVDANVTQAASDLVPVVIDQIAQTVGGQRKDFREALGQWALARPEVFFQLLPFALIGGGLTGLRDFKDGGRSTFSPENMARAGFSPEQQMRINLSSNTEEKLQRYQEEFAKRTPENIAAGLQKTEADISQIQADQNDPGKLTIGPITLPEGAKGWAVTTPDGKEFQTSDLGTATLHHQDESQQSTQSGSLENNASADPKSATPSSGDPSGDKADQNSENDLQTVNSRENASEPTPATPEFPSLDLNIERNAAGNVVDANWKVLDADGKLFGTTPDRELAETWLRELQEKAGIEPLPKRKQEVPATLDLLRTGDGEGMRISNLFDTRDAATTTPEIRERLDALTASLKDQHSLTGIDPKVRLLDYAPKADSGKAGTAAASFIKSFEALTGKQIHVVDTAKKATFNGMTLNGLPQHDLPAR